MNYIKEAENYLKYYRNLKKSLDHANYMINNFTWLTAPNSIHAVVNDPSGISARKPVNTVEQLYELVRWQEQKKQTQKEIDHIEEILNDMVKEKGCEKYRRVLEMWYVEKEDKEYIAQELNYCTRNVFRVKEKALEKFAVTLFGIKALKAI